MKLRYSLTVAVSAIILLLPFRADAQFCSCAAAPMISTQDLASAKQGNLTAGLTYQYHDISELYTESRHLDVNTYQLKTHSTLFEVNYGITSKLLASGTVSMIQKRRTNGELQRSHPITTRGISEGLMMLKYTLHQNTIDEQYQLAVGGGMKVPLGPTNIKRNQVLLQRDMQPSTGSLDGIVWGHISKTYLPSSTINTFATVSYRLTGSDDRHPNQDFAFSFGNEFIAKTGISNNIVNWLNYSLQFKFRHAAPSTINGTEFSNSGGQWLNAVPGINVRVSPALSLRMSGEIPLYRYVNGVQPSTQFIGNFSLYYDFN